MAKIATYTDGGAIGPVDNYHHLTLEDHLTLRGSGSLRGLRMSEKHAQKAYIQGISSAV